jgi:hypothetical protein
MASYIAGLALAAILAASGIGKLLDINRFRLTLMDTYSFNPTASKILAISTPLAELAIAGLLAAPPLASVGLGIAAAFLGGMAATAARAWTAGADGECGCFGVLATTKLSGWTVVRLVVAVFAALGLLIWRLDAVSPPGGPLTAPILSWVLLGVGVVLIAVVCWISLSIFRARPPQADPTLRQVE